jgi:hypothetical protein
VDIFKEQTEEVSKYLLRSIILATNTALIFSYQMGEYIQWLFVITEHFQKSILQHR